ncbi:XRE family transcriptional regulator [Streptomyces sp. NBC_00006]|uniref:XRE family transcriptional regulator n=1 Tax=Streptomyces sp. NBC_00006 TaxID=2975619 RepID=UPI00224D7636|nr:XRE family transcriptional regulator [Streptomyces sp. NBC_00006]MCX5535429.1 XRE family transcriptional regulator [Streptomyces sp. NBC_00006]
MVAGGWTHATLAEQVGIDPKSVERWVNLGRVPRRTTAHKASEILGEDVHALWPSLRQARTARAVSPELVALYERRADLPVSAFIDLISAARSRVDILVYAGVFLHEAYPGLNDLLARVAGSGGQVRIAVGDADSTNVRARGLEEKFGHGIESRCRLALMHYMPLVGVPGVEVRTHSTTLYNSLYRVDDQMLVNAHVWGVNAYGAPVWHLRRAEGGTMFDTYAESFDAVWATGTPVATEAS